MRNASVNLLVGLTLLSTWSLGQSTSSTRGQNLLPEIQVVPSLNPAKAEPEPSKPNVPASLARPILFVHGWCGQAPDWFTTVQNIRNQLMAANPSFYQNGQIFGAYYRGFNNGVQFYDLQTGTLLSEAQIPSSARFFVIELIDPTRTDSAIFDSSNVAQIPISVKADEVFEVLSSMQDVTFVQDGIVVAHSMGGLVARAYLEGLGSPLSVGNAGYVYSPGSLSFAQNLGSIITIDTPHGGVPMGAMEALLGDGLFCGGVNGGLNRSEMIPGNANSVIEPLNYVSNATLHNTLPKAIPTTFPIRSIRSYNTSDWGFTPNSDGVVTANNQDIRLALQGQIALTENLQSLDNFEGPIPTNQPTDCRKFGFYILHFIQCVGVQTSTANLVLQSIVSDALGIPLGVFQVAAPSLVIGGNGTVGTLTLTTGAPVHGATVRLQSDDPVVQVPATIFISAGVSTVSFSVMSSAVSVQKTVHVTASYGQASQMATINVQPAQAQVEFSGTSLSFSSQLVNLRSAGQQVLLTNSGTAPMSISGIIISGDFEQSNNCPATLAAGASCQINVVYRPRSLGSESGTLTVADSAPGSPHIVQLSGTGFDISLTIPRVSRRNRATSVGGSAQREVTVAIGIVGIGDIPITVSCLTAACIVKPGPATGTWDVSRQVTRSLRLQQAAGEVVLRVTAGEMTKDIPVPIN